MSKEAQARLLRLLPENLGEYYACMQGCVLRGERRAKRALSKKVISDAYNILLEKLQTVKGPFEQQALPIFFHALFTESLEAARLGEPKAIVKICARPPKDSKCIGVAPEAVAEAMAQLESCKQTEKAERASKKAAKEAEAEANDPPAAKEAEQPGDKPPKLTPDVVLGAIERVVTSECGGQTVSSWDEVRAIIGPAQLERFKLLTQMELSD